MTKKNLKKKRDGEILAKKKRGERKKKFESGAVDNAGFNMQAKKKKLEKKNTKKLKEKILQHKKTLKAGKKN